MFRVDIKDDKFNHISFKFASMEEVSIFAETALRSAEEELEVTIERIKEE